MPDHLSVALHVIGLTGNGVQVVTQQSTGWAFWLPRERSVRWINPPQVGGFETVILPEWLASKHRQLHTAIAYEKKLRSEFAKPIDQPTHQKEANVAYEQRDMSGSLFRVDPEKRQTDKWPEFEGSVIVEGRKYYLSGWVKVSERSGKKFFSLALKRADDKPAANNGKPQAKAQAADPYEPF